MIKVNISSVVIVLNSGSGTVQTPCINPSIYSHRNPDRHAAEVNTDQRRQERREGVSKMGMGVSSEQ